MRKHPVDVFSLVCGLVFVAIASAYIAGAYTTLHIDARLVVPALLVGLGVAGLSAAILAQRRADRRIRSTPLPQAEASTTDDAAGAALSETI